VLVIFVEIGIFDIGGGDDKRIDIEKGIVKNPLFQFGSEGEDRVFRYGNHISIMEYPGILYNCPVLFLVRKYSRSEYFFDSKIRGRKSAGGEGAG